MLAKILIRTGDIYTPLVFTLLNSRQYYRCSIGNKVVIYLRDNVQLQASIYDVYSSSFILQLIDNGSFLEVLFADIFALFYQSPNSV